MTDPNQADFEIPSILSHVSIGTNNFKDAVTFYDKVLATVGARRVLDFPEHPAVAYGKQFPEFWVHPPHNGKPAETGNGVHFAFLVSNKAMVHSFHEAALAAGGKDDGAPGPREHYGPAYYGCFIRDLEGNKIEAMYLDESKAK